MSKSNPVTLRLKAQLFSAVESLSLRNGQSVAAVLEDLIESGLERSHSNIAQNNSKGGFSFIDLFAGIGGFRTALDGLGGQCVFSSEWDKHSAEAYRANYGERPHGDITKIDPSTIPFHDLLVGGFPCQPFSIAGVSKKKSMGKAHGFEDLTQGTLFFNVANIIAKKRPKAFILENVKNLMSHDKGNTFRIISKTLDELGYHWSAKVVDAKGWTPQHRERIFIVGFNKDIFPDKPAYSFPTPPESRPALSDILSKKVDEKYTLSDKLWNYLVQYAEKHKAKGNGFGFGLVTGTSVTRTLSARYYKDGSEILINQGRNKNPRRLTPNECAKLMGFPDTFKIVSSDTQAYKQFGNAVVVPVVTAVARGVVELLCSAKPVLATKKSIRAAQPRERSPEM